jgi:sugar phosphate isomerase/epimerase
MRPLTFRRICKWAADLGFKGIQMPTLDTRFIDLQKRQKARLMLEGKIASYGLEITELSTHLQGQWLPFILLMMT